MNLRALIILTCSALSSQGQDYLVTTKLDTLRGKLTVITYPGMDKIQVSEQKKKKQEINVTVVLIAMLSGQAYKTVPTTDGYRLMRLAKSGILSLCYARQSPGTPYDTPYLVKSTGESMEVPKILFKNRMSGFLKDCPLAAQKVEAGTLGKNDVEKIVDEYNQCMDKQTEQAFVAVADTGLKAITEFKLKLEQDKTVPADALEILKDIYQKVKEEKSVPNYLKNSLREALKSHPSYQADLDNLLDKLKE